MEFIELVDSQILWGAVFGKDILRSRTVCSYSFLLLEGFTSEKSANLFVGLDRTRDGNKRDSDEQKLHNQPNKILAMSS